MVGHRPRHRCLTLPDKDTANHTTHNIMKFIGTVFLTFALVLGGLHLTSCKAFSASDAQALGVQIATSSLAVATKMAAGEPVNMKAEVAMIGLQTASSAVATVKYNLSAPAATPQSIVSSSHDAAQNIIANAAVPDPAIAAQAASIATQAVAVAQSKVGAATAPTGN